MNLIFKKNCKKEYKRYLNNIYKYIKKYYI